MSLARNEYGGRVAGHVAIDGKLLRGGAIAFPPARPLTPAQFRKHCSRPSRPITSWRSDYEGGIMWDDHVIAIQPLLFELFGQLFSRVTAGGYA
jgi:hypothetical protein